MMNIKEYSEELNKALNSVSQLDFEFLISALHDACINGKNIFVMGNGGSGSTASHFASDMNKGASNKDRKFKFISLNDSVPLILSYANDISYDSIFIKQLENLAKPGDIVIGFSGSGESKNVLKAIGYANMLNCVTVGFTGYSGGNLKKMAKISIHVDIEDMQITEDCHLAITHLLMQNFKDLQ